MSEALEKVSDAYVPAAPLTHKVSLAIARYTAAVCDNHTSLMGSPSNFPAFVEKQARLHLALVNEVIALCKEGL